MLPLPVIAALASLAVGTFARQQQMKKIKSEQQSRVNAETMRQRGIDRERQAALDNALPKFDRASQEERQGDIAENLEQYLRPAARPAPDGEYVAENPGVPVEIKERQARVLHDSLLKGRDYAKRLAQVSAFGRLGFDNSRDMNRAGESIGRLNTQSERSSAILPLELQAAQSAGDKYALISDIANGVGQIAMMYSLGGGAPAGGAAGGTGVTVPEDMFQRTISRGPAMRPGGGLGLRAPGVPRLSF